MTGYVWRRDLREALSRDEAEARLWKIFPRASAVQIDLALIVADAYAQSGESRSVLEIDAAIALAARVRRKRARQKATPAAKARRNARARERWATDPEWREKQVAERRARQPAITARNRRRRALCAYQQNTQVPS